jgi:hypothetical protein
MAEDIRRVRCSVCGETKLIFVHVDAEGAVIGPVKCRDCERREQAAR